MISPLKPFIALTLLILSVSVEIIGQELKTADRADIEARIEALQSSVDPDGNVLENYKQILGILDQKEEIEVRVRDFRAKLDSLDSDLKGFRDELSQLVAKKPELPVTLNAAEEALEAAKTSLDDAARTMEVLSERENANRERRTELSGEIQKVKDEIATIPATQSLEEDVSEAVRSRNELQKARLGSLESRLQLLELEDSYLEKSPVLNSAKKNVAAKKLDIYSKSRALLSDHVANLRKIDASSTLKAAEQSLEDVAKSSQTLKTLARKNVELASRKSGPGGITELLTKATENLAKSEAELRKINSRVESARVRTEILEANGLSLDSETGNLLRQQRAEMPGGPLLKSRISELITKVTTAHLELIKLEEEQSEFLLRKNQILNNAAANGISGEGSSSVQNLIDTREELYEELVSSQREYVNALDSHLKTLQNTRVKVLSHQKFVDERLLWIRSSSFYGLNALKADLSGFKKIVVGDLAKKWWDALLSDMKEAGPLWIAFALLWVLWRIFTSRIKKYIVELNKVARSPVCTRFSPTLKAAVLLVLLAATYPVVFWFFGWRLRDAAFSEGLNAGLFTVSIFIFLFQGARLMSESGGFLQAHLGFSKERCALLHNHTSWFIFVFPMLIFPAVVLLESDQIEVSGRGFFILATLVMGFYLHELFLPKKHFIPLKVNRQWFAYPVYFVSVITPAFLALGAIFGFFHSASILREKIDASIWILALSAFFVGFFLRWVLVSRRHAAITEAINKRNALAERDDELEEDDDRSLEEIKADAAGIVELQLRTRQLARLIVITVAAIALWSVWSSTLPALNVLDSIAIWESKETTAAVSDSSTGVPLLLDSNEGDTETKVITRERVSLQNLLFSLFALFLTVVGARNIPAFLDLLFLRRYYTKRGGAFAITTSLRYLIVAFGTAYALGHIGIEWSKIQWIAAAITLGVGFGLQEIFANFVAGLIILFERPIRLGDYVTLGDVSGRVSKIQIRATTIIDFSSKELIVPNKEFITGRLINWTLTDPVIRVEIPVGIAYGSDTEMAKEILERVGRENALALDSPEPKAVFLSFGASSLDFELRVHIKGSENLMSVTSQLHFAIDRAFREAGVEIPFPQRDIHIRTAPQTPKIEIVPDSDLT